MPAPQAEVQAVYEARIQYQRLLRAQSRLQDRLEVVNAELEEQKGLLEKAEAALTKAIDRDAENLPPLVVP